MNDRFIIFGRSSCPFCVFAQDLCSAKKISFQFLDYENKPDIIEECKVFYKQETVPIILANNIVTGKVHKVGGYSDLLEYVK